eukprot:jgi/Galph1/2252/GphlegSOOS_G940.1
MTKKVVTLTESVAHLIKQWKQENGQLTHTTVPSPKVMVIGWLVGEASEESIDIYHVVRNSPWTDYHLDTPEQVLEKDVSFYSGSLPGPHIRILGPIYQMDEKSDVDTRKNWLLYEIHRCWTSTILQERVVFNIETETFYMQQNETKQFFVVATLASVVCKSTIEREWYCFHSETKVPFVLFDVGKCSRDRIDIHLKAIERIFKRWNEKMDFLMETRNHSPVLLGKMEMQIPIKEMTTTYKEIQPVDKYSTIRQFERNVIRLQTVFSQSIKSSNVNYGTAIAIERGQMVRKAYLCVLRTVSLVYSQDNIEQLISSLKNQFLNQLKYWVLIMDNQSEECQLEWNIFKPLCLLFPITAMMNVVDTSEIEEDYMKEERRKYQLCFQVDYFFPWFRSIHQLFALKESSIGFIDKHLLDVHLGLVKQKSNDNILQAQTKGSYYYFHYMQNGIADKGWGCAYRSLQTIVSWFWLQGYTNEAVPSHDKIQQILVELGDKESSFLHSKQWIGATEVCYVLQALLGVESKILFVPSGAQIDLKARELIQHFRTQATPIMVGGGVLAYTLLGVEYNEVTGETRYLILDPHYVGEDDIQVILSKGWCGWKTNSIFDKNSFYNLCLPLRPTDIV